MVARHFVERPSKVVSQPACPPGRLESSERTIVPSLRCSWPARSIPVSTTGDGAIERYTRACQQDLTTGLPPRARRAGVSRRELLMPLVNVT